MQHSYRLPEEEAEIPKVGLKQLEVITKTIRITSYACNRRKSAYSSLQEELKKLAKKLSKLKKSKSNSQYD